MPRAIPGGFSVFGRANPGQAVALLDGGAMLGRASDDPIGFYGGWNAYFVATYLMAGVAVPCGISPWVLWFAPLSVPTFLFLTFPLWSFSVFALLMWMLMAGVVVVAVQGDGGILEHGRTPRQALRSVALLSAAIAVELWLPRRE